MLNLKIASLMFLVTMPSLFAESAPGLKIGSTLPELTLSGEHGGLVSDGSAWSSQSMRGKLNFVVYVDPDDHALNEELTEKLSKEKYPSEVLASVALINLAASWKPNGIIMSVLRGKQKQYPRTTYVYDKDKTVAQQWGLISEGYHVLLFSKEGNLLFEKTGKLSSPEVDSFLAMLKEQVKVDQEKLGLKDGAKEETKKSL